METKFLIRLSILLLLIILFTRRILVFGQAQSGIIIPFPEPQLKTSRGGVYSETSWELVRMRYNYTLPADHAIPPGDIYNPSFKGILASSPPKIRDYYIPRLKLFYPDWNREMSTDLLKWEQHWVNTPWRSETVPYEDPLQITYDLVLKYSKRETGKVFLNR